MATQVKGNSGTQSKSRDLVEREELLTEYRNNGDKVLNLRVDTDAASTASKETWKTQIQVILETLCPFLLPSNDNDGDSSRLQIKPLTGGLSNHLLLASNNSKTVLVRIHPDTKGETASEFSVVDREREPKFAAWLASHKEKLAPTIYGRFANGRVEEFYTNTRPLAWGEMKYYAPWIAERMASFHSLDAPPSDVLPRPTKVVTATIYGTIGSWLNEARSTIQKRKTEHDSEAKNEGEELFLSQLSSEWAWLENELRRLPPPPNHARAEADKSTVAEALTFIRRIAVTHMDCQPLNILIGNDDDENNAATANFAQGANTLRLIDFEYAGWNPIAADIANTFCEYCEATNLCADWDKEYPTPAQQDTFFWNYLLHSDPQRAKKFSSYPRRQQDPNHYAADDAEWNLFCATLQKEVGRFSLLSHLGWSIWSVIKAQEEGGVDFDYMAYAHHRMEGYTWSKKRYIATTGDTVTD